MLPSRGCFWKAAASICFFHLQLLPSLTSQHFAQPTHSDSDYFGSGAVRGAARSEPAPQREAGCCGRNPTPVLAWPLAVLPLPPSGCTNMSRGRGSMGRAEDIFFHCTYMGSNAQKTPALVLQS